MGTFHMDAEVSLGILVSGFPHCGRSKQCSGYAKRQAFLIFLHKTVKALPSAEIIPILFILPFCLLID